MPLRLLQYLSLLQQVCHLGDLLGAHGLFDHDAISSDDPLGTYRASKRALGLPVDVGSVDEAPGPMSRARRAACLLSANDIVLLGYAPPAQCEDDLRRLEARRRAEQLFGG